MFSLSRAALAALLTLAVAPAAAQDPPAQGDAEIVVEGRRFEEQVRDFVAALTPVRNRETIERFQDAVCPAVRGLTARQNDAVLARLRTVGTAVGLRMAAPGCTPNALLVATEDKGRLIRALAASRPWTFGDLTAREVRRLADSPGPSAAWQLKGLVNADGHPIHWDNDAGFFLNRTTRAATRAQPAAYFVFEGTVLVVERAALLGLDVTQLADFAAMRLYARTDPARLEREGAATILTVLDAPMGSAVPLSLTAWDLAFLRGLYASPANNFAAAQRATIRRDMRDALRPADEEN